MNGCVRLRGIEIIVGGYSLSLRLLCIASVVLIAVQNLFGVVLQTPHIESNLCLNVPNNLGVDISISVSRPPPFFDILMCFFADI